MPNSIPSFDHNLVLPPHKGSPTVKSDLSPYPCSTLELCQRFASSAERIAILDGFLRFRDELQRIGLREGFQWLDGSFLEDVELREIRPPTVYSRNFRSSLRRGRQEQTIDWITTPSMLVIAQ